MGDPRGFLNIGRKEAGYRLKDDRILDYGEVELILGVEDRAAQASRCMDCGVPFCHWACPIDNRMPEWQDALYRGDLEEAYEVLSSTNAFPEFTGRICPALCEKSCVLAIHDEAVTIRENEVSLTDQAFARGLVLPKIPTVESGKTVAVIGSGPAGLTAAYWLNQKGHKVTVFEQDDAIGGLLRYGIPDFKLNKKVIDRRVAILRTEGVEFKLSCSVGKDISTEEISSSFDAVVVAIGSMVPRDLPIEGRELEGVHFAMDFLKQQNKVIRGETFGKKRIDTKGKSVIVIGGGDTGSDCVGTSNRQGASAIKQIEIMDKPSECRSDDNPWPYWPQTLRTSSSHLEGCDRQWNLSTKRFIGKNGKLKQTEVVTVEWSKSADGKMKMKEVKGSNQIIDTDFAFLSMGFVNPVKEGLLEQLGVELDNRGNVCSSDNKTSIDKVFVAGDATSGASLVVTAMRSGRDAADQVDLFLQK